MTPKSLEEDEEAEFGYASSSYYRALEQKIATLRNERKVLIRQRNDYQKKMNEAKTELNRLRKPPLLVGTLVEIVDDDQAIVKSSTGPTFIVQIASDVDRTALIPGTQVALNQRTFSLVEIMAANYDPLVRGMEIEERPDVDYSDIGGLDEQVRELSEAIELSLLHPELFDKVGIESPKGVLLHGPPGSGKTLMARAVAHRTNASFISVIGSQLVQKYIGEGARLVRELFDYANKREPAIVFIDELDAIGSKRLDIATSGDREVQRTFMQLLSELDGFAKRGNTKVIGATNRIDILDPALLRPGRFDRLIEVPIPDEKGRAEIFKIHSRKMNLIGDIDFTRLAKLAGECTGADIKAITVEAGMMAIREMRSEVGIEDLVVAVKRVKAKKSEDGDKFSYM
ncbi:MAG: proteasome-activating nucleotidase [Candidatus Hodarchaeales archaeon]|jgi:proteasome regulatory subunit